MLLIGFVTTEEEKIKERKEQKISNRIPEEAITFVRPIFSRAFDASTADTLIKAFFSKLGSIADMCMALDDYTFFKMVEAIYSHVDKFCAYRDKEEKNLKTADLETLDFFAALHQKFNEIR